MYSLSIIKEDYRRNCWRKGLSLVNPAKETAKDLKQILENNNILREGTEYDAKYEYYVSDIPEKFAVIAEEFLKKEIYDIKSIKI